VRQRRDDDADTTVVVYLYKLQLFLMMMVLVGSKTSTIYKSIRIEEKEEKDKVLTDDESNRATTLFPDHTIPVSIDNHTSSEEAGSTQFSAGSYSSSKDSVRKPVSVSHREP
jgi:hypothetical protein